MRHSKASHLKGWYWVSVRVAFAGFFAAVVMVSAAAPVLSEEDLALEYNRDSVFDHPVSLNWENKAGDENPIKIDEHAEYVLPGGESVVFGKTEVNMYLDQNDKNVFINCKNKLCPILSYNGDKVDGIEIPVLYVRDKNSEPKQFLLHVLEKPEQFSRMKIMAKLFENGKAQHGYWKKSEMNIHPIVLSNKDGAPQPVVVFIDDNLENTSEKARVWAKLATSGNVSKMLSCKQAALKSGDDTRPRQEMDAESTADVQTTPKVRMIVVDRDGRTEQTGYSYVKVLTGKCDKRSGSGKKRDWRSTEKHVPISAGKEKPICVMFSSKKTEKGSSCATRYFYDRHAKAKFLEIFEGSISRDNCRRGAFRFRVKVGEETVSAREVHRLLSREISDRGNLKTEGKWVLSYTKGGGRDEISNALRKYYLGGNWPTNPTKKGTLIYKANKKAYVHLSDIQLKLIDRETGTPVNICVLQLHIPKNNLVGIGNCQESSGDPKMCLINGVLDYPQEELYRFGEDKDKDVFVLKTDTDTDTDTDTGNVSLTFTSPEEGGSKPCRLAAGTYSSVEWEELRQGQFQRKIAPPSVVKIVSFHHTTVSWDGDDPYEVQDDFLKSIPRFHELVEIALDPDKELGQALIKQKVGFPVKKRKTRYWSSVGGGSVEDNISKTVELKDKIWQLIKNDIKKVPNHELWGSLDGILDPRVVVIVGPVKPSLPCSQDLGLESKNRRGSTATIFLNIVQSNTKYIDRSDDDNNKYNDIYRDLKKKGIYKCKSQDYNYTYAINPNRIKTAQKTIEYIKQIVVGAIKNNETKFFQLQTLKN